MRIPRTRLLLATLLVVLTGCEEKKLVETDCFQLVEELGLPDDGNACKIFDVAIDTQRDRLYVHSIVTPQIAVINTRTDTLLEYIDTGLEGYHIAYMDVNTSTGKLFIADQGSEKLIKIDPSAGHVSSAEVDLGHKPTKILVSNAHVFVAFASQDELRVYRCSDLGHVKTLDCEDGIYAPQGMKLRDDMLYVALSRGQESRGGTTSGVAIVDPDTWKVTNVACEHKGATEVAVNASRSRFWLLSENRLRATDETGTLLANRTFSCEAKEILYSRGLGRVLLLTRDGGDYATSEAPYGTLELLDPETLETVTKYRLGAKTSRMAIHGGDHKVYAASMASGTVSVVDYEDQVLGSESSTGSGSSEQKYSVKLFEGEINQSMSSFAGQVSSTPAKQAMAKSSTPDAELATAYVDPDRVLAGIDHLESTYESLQYEAIAEAIDVGSSIEDLLAHPDGDKVYLLSRLGGSHIHQLNVSTGCVETIDVDRWPTQMALDEDRRELYVLSHFESKIDVIDIDSNEIVDRIDLTDAGVDRCRTHFLSNMAYDRSRARLYCSFPELGLLVEVNVEDRSVEQVVEAFTPATDEDGGPQVGRAQLAVDSQSSRVFLYLRHEATLEVRDPFQDLDVVQEISFSGSTFSDNDYASRLLTADSYRRRLFVGPRVYSISAGKLSYEQTISKIEKVAAVDTGNNYLLGVVANNDQSVMLYLYSGSSYDKLASATIHEMETYPPRLVLDPVKERIYAAYMDPALVEVYAIQDK